MNQATTDHDAFFNAIVEQRAFEFAGESLRKADLIRWNLLKTKLDEAKDKMKNWHDVKVLIMISLTSFTTKLQKMVKTLLFYGLNHGETENAPADYESTTWINTEKLPDALIDVLYQKNPDENQYCPSGRHSSTAVTAL